MNIGILTYHWVSNFGANLQTLSTYKYIENAGHKPIIINWIPDDLKNIYEQKVPQEQSQMHVDFGKEYYKNITAICKNKYDVAAAIDLNEIDLVIIGSDAVFSYTPILSRFRVCRRGLWYFKPISDFDCPNPFWADFYPLVKRKVKVVAMSASAQNTPYRKIVLPFERNRFIDAIRHFSYISVRDIWTSQMLNYIQGTNIHYPITPDPVFAFEQNVHPENRNIAKDYLSIDSPYVILSVTKSITNIGWIKSLEQLFSEKGIILIGLPQTNIEYNSILKFNMPFPLPPIDWYNFIKNSQGYIGELMHPILVSLHNSVPIFSVDLYGFRKGGHLIPESSKTYQIIQTFNLLQNYYSCKDSRELPSPEYVFTQITHFNREECRKMSSMMYDRYNEMMNNIIEFV